MTTSTSGSEQITFYKNGLRFLNYRPSILIAILWFIPLVYIYSFSDYKTEQLTFYTYFLIGLTGSFATEQFWVNMLRSKNQVSRVLYQRIQPYRMMFVSAGFLSSIFMMLVSTVLVYTMIYYVRPTFLTADGKLAGRYLSWFYLFTSIFLAFNLAYFYGATFFQMRSYSIIDQKIKFYFQTPKQILSLISYFILGWFIPVTILWVGEITGPLQVFQMNQSSTYAIALNIDRLLFGAGGLFVILSSSMFLGLVLSATQIHHLLHKKEFNYLKLIKNRNIAMKNLGILFAFEILGIIAIFYSLVPPSIILYAHVLIFVLPVGFIVRFFYSAHLPKSFCGTCGYLLSNETCEICSEEELKIDFDYEIPQIGTIKHPKCPNCKQLWDSLSRQCSNCKYTIILSCENCSQTLNPLWRECNRCGKERTPIPVQAMTIPTNKRYSVNRGKLMYLFILFLLLSITSTINWVYRLNQRNVLFSDFTQYTYPGREFAFMILAVVTMIFLGYLIYQSYQDQNKSIILILSYLIFYPITLCFLVLLVFLITFVPTNISIFTRSSDGTFVFSGLVVVLILVSLSALFLYLLGKKIIQNYRVSRNTIPVTSEIDGGMLV